MPYLSGVVTGVILTVLVVFVVDHTGTNSPDFVNWDRVGNALGSSVEQAGEQVRQEVHEATAPENTSRPADNTTPPSPATGQQ
jgi:hypothetical protein